MMDIRLKSFSLTIAVTLFCITAPIFAAQFDDEIDRSDPDFVTASLIIASPGKELYSRVGHASIRMECPKFNLDFCFTYESESALNKIFKFFSGNLKMGMFAVPTSEYLNDYVAEGRGITQYKLNLPPDVETRLWEILDQKVAEGANLPYDFLKRGCAQALLKTLLAAAPPKTLTPGNWPDKYKMTRREIFASHMSNFPWTLFFLQSFVGTEIDRDVPNLEKIIIPHDLLEFLRTATIDGRPIITDSGTALTPLAAPYPKCQFRPIHLAFIIMAIAIVGCFTKDRITDLFFLTIQSILGCFLTYLVFFTDLPTTNWHWLIIPFNPLPLIFWKWRKRWIPYFAVILVIWICAMLISPHRLTDNAFVVIVASLLIDMLRHTRCDKTLCQRSQ